MVSVSHNHCCETVNDFFLEFSITPTLTCLVFGVLESPRWTLKLSEASFNIIHPLLTNCWVIYLLFLIIHGQNTCTDSVISIRQKCFNPFGLTAMTRGTCTSDPSPLQSIQRPQHLSEHSITERQHLSVCKHSSVTSRLPCLGASVRPHGPKSEGDQLIIRSSFRHRQNR